MTMPSVEALEMAAQWLDVYEHGEHEPLCHHVADWIREQARAKLKREAEALAIKRLAAERGVTASTLKKQLAACRKQSRLHSS